jgi:negative regulator of flagellin synthesis FlgM
MVNPIGQKQARDAYVSRAQGNQGVQRAEADRAQRKQSGSLATGEEGSVQLSDGLRSIQQAVDAVRQAPDIRAERVAALRQQIESGHYDVSSMQVAAKILGKIDVD